MPAYLPTPWSWGRALFAAMILLFALCLLPVTLPAQAPPVDSYTALPGYFPLYWDAASGKLRMLVDKWDTEFLYVNSLPAGVGSNDLGLDRGQLGSQRIVFFQRVGPKVLLIQPNYRYRARTQDAAERAAVEQSFAQSVLWGFRAEWSDDSRALIDVTDFLLRDAHNVIQTLRGANQGEYKLDASRSALFLERTRNFPQNTEMEAIVSYTTDRKPGAMLEGVAASPANLTVRQHHSFIQLPDDNYTPRTFDPRSGYGSVTFTDYAAPLEAPIDQRFLPRHRLKKKNPTAAVSEPEEPIVYYLDRGAPEPIRSALLEGARWWNQAFEAAGYKDAFRVELMPEGADPMDVRYNVIQWVHRSTRGWSYGSSVRDPRTGEILKGHVTLGSLRVRQDYLIATGLLAPYETGKPADERMRELALARLRQLSAHEVGHTLGLSHNFASSMDGRASVMDYPHPYIALGEDTLDLSDSYATGIGEWDKVTIAYGYQHFPAGTDESAALAKILDDAFARGLRYITDRDSRPEGGASPIGHLWDNGKDAIAELQRLGAVRRHALNRFTENVLRPGEPLASLGDTLVPIYLLHRYQVEAAAKSIGGLDYAYTLRGSGDARTQIVPRARQEAALNALLETITPAYLRLPESLLERIPPYPPGYDRTRESFPTRTGLTFDPLSAAETAADYTLRFLLHPERAARLLQYAARDPQQMPLNEYLDRVFQPLLPTTPATGMEGELQRVALSAALYRLMVLANETKAPDQVKALVHQKLQQLENTLRINSPNPKANSNAHAFYQFAANRIQRFREEPGTIPMPKPQPAPPGQPIGCGEAP